MIAASTIFAERQFEHDRGLEHPWNGRPEFFQRHAQRMRGRIGHRVWAELLQPTAGLVALEAARQIILRRSCRFGGQSTCRGRRSSRGHRLVETPCHRALRRFRDVGRLGRILSVTTSPIAYRKSCPPFKTTLLIAWPRPFRQCPALPLRILRIRPPLRTRGPRCGDDGRARSSEFGMAPVACSRARRQRKNNRKR